MSYLDTNKGNTLYKFFILVPFICAFVLHSGRSLPINQVSTTTGERRTSLSSHSLVVPSKSSIAPSRVNNSTTRRDPLRKLIHKETAQTAWCVLDDDNLGKSFYHFPHTLQVLSKCWSYFMMERRKYGVKSCGFFYNVINRKNFNYNKISPWAKDLIKAMNCSKIVRKSKSTPKPPDTDDSYYLKWTSRWFQEIEDVAPIQESVLRKRKEGYSKLDEFANRTLVIGLVQRRPRLKHCDSVPAPKNCVHYREIINLKKIQQALAKNFPSAKVRNTKFKNMDLVEQASWWWHKDIVIAAHGAALSNVMFMRPHTAVIEIFPTNYEKNMFQVLMKDVGVYGYRLLRATQKGKKGFKNRNVPLNPNVDEIVRLVRKAIQQRQNATSSKVEDD